MSKESEERAVTGKMELDQMIVQSELAVELGRAVIELLEDIKRFDGAAESAELVCEVADYGQVTITVSTKEPTA